MNHLTPSTIANAVLAVLCLLLAGAVWSDIRQRRISNRLVLAGACVGIVFNTVLPEGFGFASALPGALGFWKALGGLAAGLGLMLPLYLLRAMGAGDVKLMAMVGSFLGPKAVAAVVLATFIAGGVMILAVVLRKGTLGRLLDNLRTMLLSSFFKLMMHESPALDAAPVSAGRMPYALAVAAGTMIYMTLKITGNDLPWIFGAIGYQYRKKQGHGNRLSPATFLTNTGGRYERFKSRHHDWSVLRGCDGRSGPRFALDERTNQSEHTQNRRRRKRHQSRHEAGARHDTDGRLARRQCSGRRIHRCQTA